MFSRTDIEKYFTGEKQESLLFLVIGVVAVLTAVVLFFFIKTTFYRGAAIPLLVVGLILGIVGFSVYRRSDADRIRNVYAFDMNPGELKEKEFPRIKKVMQQFVIYRYAELFLFLLGAGIYIWFIRDWKHDFWRGFGLALAFMALTALVADFFAEKRGKKYIKGLEQFIQQSSQKDEK